MIPNKLLIHECDYTPYAGRDRTGDTYGAQVSGVRCYIDERRKLVRDINGEEAVSETTVYLNGDSSTALVAGSLMTIRGKAHRVMAVKPYESPVGSLLEVNLE